MATHVRSHGGDGGDRPPHDHPSRIPSGCESSEPRGVRGRGKNKNLEIAFEKNNMQPLPVEFDQRKNMFKVVGDNQSMYIRCVSNEVLKLHFHYDSWKDVPDEEKASVFNVIYYYFDIKKWENTQQWSQILAGIHDDSRVKYKNRKNELKNHFKNCGGYKDVEKARKHVPEQQTQAKWNKLIDDLFLNEEYIKRCEKNSNNRKKQPYPSAGGSRSYAQYRYIERKEAGKSSDIEGWRKMHYKMQTGWVNEKAEEDWEKIQIELNKMRNAQPEGEEIDEAECLTRALGERRGWTKGVGRRVRYTPYDPSCGTYFATPAQWQQMQNTVTGLVAQIHELTKRQNEESSQIEEGEGDAGNEEEDDEGSEEEDC